MALLLLLRAWASESSCISVVPSCCCWGAKRGEGGKELGGVLGSGERRGEWGGVELDRGLKKLWLLGRSWVPACFPLGGEGKGELEWEERFFWGVLGEGGGMLLVEFTLFLMEGGVAVDVVGPAAEVAVEVVPVATAAAEVAVEVVAVVAAAAAAAAGACVAVDVVVVAAIGPCVAVEVADDAAALAWAEDAVEVVDAGRAIVSARVAAVAAAAAGAGVAVEEAADDDIAAKVRVAEGVVATAAAAVGLEAVFAGVFSKVDAVAGSGVRGFFMGEEGEGEAAEEGAAIATTGAGGC